jgi:hypothetical protein
VSELVSESREYIPGTTIASAVLLCLSATKARSGGTTAPPPTPATINPDALLVCFPTPLMPNATWVGKLERISHELYESER